MRSHRARPVSHRPVSRRTRSVSRPGRPRTLQPDRLGRPVRRPARQAARRPRARRPARAAVARMRPPTRPRRSRPAQHRRHRPRARQRRSRPHLAGRNRQPRRLGNPRSRPRRRSQRQPLPSSQRQPLPSSQRRLRRSSRPRSRPRRRSRTTTPNRHNRQRPRTPPSQVRSREDPYRPECDRTSGDRGTDPILGRASRWRICRPLIWPALQPEGGVPELGHNTKHQSFSVGLTLTRCDVEHDHSTIARHGAPTPSGSSGPMCRTPRSRSMTVMMRYIWSGGLAAMRVVLPLY